MLQLYDKQLSNDNFLFLVKKLNKVVSNSSLHNSKNIIEFK